MYFPDRCVHTLLTLYVYATEGKEGEGKDFPAHPLLKPRSATGDDECNQHLCISHCVPCTVDKMWQKHQYKIVTATRPDYKTKIKQLPVSNKTTAMYIFVA